MEKNALGWMVGFDGSAAEKTEVSFGEKCVVGFNSKLSPTEENVFQQMVGWFKEGAKFCEVSTTQQARPLLRSLLKRIEVAKALPCERADALIECAVHSLAGLGPLDFLLPIEEIEEIAAVGPSSPLFVYHRDKGWLQTNCSFTSSEEAINAINKMARSLGRRVAYQTPRLNATLPDGSRLHASIAPVCCNGFEFSIRKFPADPLTPVDLVARGTISAQAAAALWLALFGDTSVLVAGNTGSGKTTTLNALFSFVPFSERIVVAEETPELRIRHPHVVRLVANEELGITLRHLAHDSLRMRPDRVVIGEVRSQSEVEALCDSLLAGQARGTYCTFHAKSSPEAISRLRTLGARDDEIAAIDLLVVQRRVPFYDAAAKRAFESRRVTEISLVNGCNPAYVFKFNPSKGVLEPCASGVRALLEKISGNYSQSVSELEAELEARTQFLSSLAAKSKAGGRQGFDQFGQAVQDYCFGTNVQARGKQDGGRQDGSKQDCSKQDDGKQPQEDEAVCK